MDEQESKDFYDFGGEDAWIDAMQSLAPIDDKPTKPLKPYSYEDPF